jgi:hypothetical protein
MIKKQKKKKNKEKDKGGNIANSGPSTTKAKEKQGKKLKAVAEPEAGATVSDDELDAILQDFFVAADAGAHLAGGVLGCVRVFSPATARPLLSLASRLLSPVTCCTI